MFDDIFNHLDTIHERGGQTNGQPLADSKDRANGYRCAVKTTLTTGNPFIGGVKYTGCVKIGDFRAIFDVHRRLSRKRCEIV